MTTSISINETSTTEDSMSFAVSYKESTIANPIETGGWRLVKDTRARKWFHSLNQSGTDQNLNNHNFEIEYENPIVPESPHVRVDSKPLQIWEGNVISIDYDTEVMHVELVAKIGDVARHTADIELEWVSEQDRELVSSGAVFYLTLFKRTKRGSIENAQELRFRRRPSWSAKQVEQVHRDAEEFVAKFKPLPTAE